MNRPGTRILALSLAMALAGCAGFGAARVDTAVMPAGGLGGGMDPDVAAINLAQYAFADAGRTYGKPADAARASAAMIYIAGAMNTSPRWQNISVLTQEQLLQGRQEVRDALGVVPTATAQQVVDSLTAAGNALAAGDEPGAIRVLGAPVFARSGESVLKTLSNMPYLRMANVSTMKAANQLFDTSSDDRL